MRLHLLPSALGCAGGLAWAAVNAVALDWVELAICLAFALGFAGLLAAAAGRWDAGSWAGPALACAGALAWLVGVLSYGAAAWGPPGLMAAGLATAAWAAAGGEPRPSLSRAGFAVAAAGAAWLVAQADLHGLSWWTPGNLAILLALLGLALPLRQGAQPSAAPGAASS